MAIIRQSVSYWGANGSYVLARGDAGVEDETGRVKVGNGVTPWAGLEYFGGGDAAWGNTSIFNSTPTIGNAGGGGSTTPPTIAALGTVGATATVDFTSHTLGSRVATMTLTSATNCTLAISNVPAGRCVLELVVTNPASGTVPTLTFPGTLIPAAPPPLSTGLGKRTVYQCVTYDGGATWWIYLVGAEL